MVPGIIYSAMTSGVSATTVTGRTVQTLLFQCSRIVICAPRFQ